LRPSVRVSVSALSPVTPFRPWHANQRLQAWMFLGIAFTEALALIGFVLFFLA